MRETDTSGRNYEGAKNEKATLTVEALNTNFLINFTLDGTTKTLRKGESIDFRLKPDGTATNLQFNFRFSNPTGGSYRVVVRPVDGKPNGRLRTFRQQGSLPVIIDYVFVPK